MHLVVVLDPCTLIPSWTGSCARAVYAFSELVLMVVLYVITVLSVEFYCVHGSYGPAGNCAKTTDRADEFILMSSPLPSCCIPMHEDKTSIRPLKDEFVNLLCLSTCETPESSAFEVPTTTIVINIFVWCIFHSVHRAPRNAIWIGPSSKIERRADLRLRRTTWIRDRANTFTKHRAFRKS